jgi:hypothetical protein
MAWTVFIHQIDCNTDNILVPPCAFTEIIEAHSTNVLPLPSDMIILILAYLFEVFFPPFPYHSWYTLIDNK